MSNETVNNSLKVESAILRLSNANEPNRTIEVKATVDVTPAGVNYISAGQAYKEGVQVASFQLDKPDSLSLNCFRIEEWDAISGAVREFCESVKAEAPKMVTFGDAETENV